MILTNKTLPRRTFLRGLGAAVALPLLDSMVPALRAASSLKAARRLGVVYVPNGVIMEQWGLKGEGTTFDWSPTLRPMDPFRPQVTVVSGLDDKPAIPLPNEGAGDHARAAGTFLTGVHVKKTEGADLQAGISMDQLAARELGKETQLGSLEMTMEYTEMLGACDAGYSCAYSNTISWRSPTTPLPMEMDPRAVFERLFGDGDSTDPASRLARIKEDQSILDALVEDVSRLGRALGPRDRTKLTEYLDSIRDVERRIQKAEEQSSRELPVFERPAGVPESFEVHAKLMFDLLALAYQADLTRVATFMMGHEVSSRAYPEIGVPDAHHPISHHQGDADKIAKCAKVNLFHMQMFAYFLDRLRATPDGEGNLLDSSIIMYGSGMSDGNVHAHLDLPLLLAGGAAGHLKGGRHLRYPSGTPVTNLHLTVLDKLGIPMERFGDSTGMLNELSL
ncbi:MAG: DUF1552 domain-containing protein [Vicinamibacterales bacterium]